MLFPEVLFHRFGYGPTEINRLQSSTYHRGLLNAQDLDTLFPKVKLHRFGYGPGCLFQIWASDTIIAV